MPAKSSCETVYYYTGAVIDNRYVLQEFLGEGGMACVYRARELHAPNPYAIKFLKSTFSNNNELIDHFGREALNMKDLAHPNIVRFYDFVHHPDYSYIAMEYIEGYSLSAVLKKLRQRDELLPLDEVVRVLTQVARGIDKIHRANFIHRDIKPGNILIAKQDGTAFVADLGIMVDLRDENLLSLAAGTRAYMPPEQQIGERVDQTADIYSFGIVAFELFAGQRPYVAKKELKREEAENDLIRQHFESPIPSVLPFRKDLPSGLDAVIAKAIAKKPADRYQNVLEFARDIHKVLAPRLSEDLQDFSEIRPLKPEARYYVDSGDQVPPQKRSWVGRFVVALAVLVGLILIGVGSAITSLNNAAALNATASMAAAFLLTPSPTLTETPTLTMTPTATETLTSTPTVTLTHTSTLTPTPSITPTPTATATATSTNTATATATPTSTNTTTSTPTPTATDTPIPAPTTSLNLAPVLPLVAGQGALGLANNAALTIMPDANRPLIRLNVGILNGFELSVTFPETINEVERYGAVYRIQDDQNYLLFTIHPSENQWQIEQVTDGRNLLIDSGEITTSNFNTLIVRGQDDFFSIEFGSQSVQHNNDIGLMGGLGLWVESNASFTLEAISISLLGDDATAPLNVLLANAEAMQATGDRLNNTVNCPVYIPLYAGLSSYLNVDELAQGTQRLIDNGQFVYQRCQAESPNAPLSFSLRDFSNWQNGLSQIINDASSGA
jgi:serine/threonine protein kinase